ncbi:MAG: hypothetical protein GWO02_13250, partial [Gammaproteobacteria bacterium]|nr:hypothetical protein [Gammaproteobacteria bacterium]
MATRMKPSGAPGDHTANALYYDPANAFDFRWPAVPRRQFLAERDRAYDADAPSGLVPLDASAELDTPYPATTPSLLARYLRLRPGDTFAASQRASGEVFYVMSGSGESTGGPDTVTWGEGDVFCMAGGQEIAHRGDGALLFCVSDAPLVAFQALRPAAIGETPIETVHWPAAEIDSRLDRVYGRERTEEEAGQAVLFSSRAMAPARNILPMMVAAINTLPSGADQRPHRHNGVAITLALRGEGVYSLIEGERIDWVEGAAQITPATE